jgi:hypothetical protein
MLTHGRSLTGSPYTDNALSAEYPADVMEAFTLATDNEDGLTIISSSIYPYVLTSTFSFNVWNAHYANPAGRWRDRTQFLELLEGESDPERFAAALMNNSYEQIDLLALAKSGDSYVVRYQDDGFPYGLEPKEHRFPAKALDGSPYFTLEEIGGVAFFAPVYANNPLSEENCSEPCALAGELEASFAGHLTP